MPQPLDSSRVACTTEQSVGWHARVIGQDHISRIFVATCQETDASPALRKAERPIVDDSVCPSVSKRLESPDEVVHRLAAFELEHEWNVL